jgi:hypothetical protein
MRVLQFNLSMFFFWWTNRARAGQSSYRLEMRVVGLERLAGLETTPDRSDAPSQYAPEKQLEGK